MVSVVRLDSLQAIRGLAAALVVLYHTGTIYAVQLDKLFAANVFRFGFSGVDIFFVLSGFTIYFSHKVHGERRASEFLVFLVKRIFRIFPVYWVVVFGKVVVTGGGIDGAEIVSTLLLLPSSHPFINVAWTLSFELAFYAIFAASLLVNSKFRLFVIFALSLAPVIPSNWLREVGLESALVSFMGSLHWVEFLFGVISAIYVRRVSVVDRSAAIAMLSIGGVSFIAAVLVGYIYSRAGVPSGASAYQQAELISNPIYENAVWIFGGATALSITGLVQLERVGLFRPNGLLNWLGDVSYSLYLCHGFVIVTFLRWSYFAVHVKEHEWLIIVPWLLCIIAAYMMYRLVEVPWQTMGGKLARIISRTAARHECTTP